MDLNQRLLRPGQNTRCEISSQPEIRMRGPESTPELIRFCLLLSSRAFPGSSQRSVDDGPRGTAIAKDNRKKDEDRDANWECLKACQRVPSASNLKLVPSARWTWVRSRTPKELSELTFCFQMQEPSPFPLCSWCVGTLFYVSLWNYGQRPSHNDCKVPGKQHLISLSKKDNYIHAMEHILLYLQCDMFV